MRDLAGVIAAGKRFFPILLCLDSLGCSSLCLRACLLPPDSPASATPLSRPNAIIIVTPRVHVHIPWSGPSVRIKTPTAVFFRHGVFPRPPGQVTCSTWQSYTTSPVVRTKRVVAPGRHMLHQVLVIIVQRHLGLAPDGHAGEVRQVHVDGHGNEDA